MRDTVSKRVCQLSESPTFEHFKGEFLFVTLEAKVICHRV